jgi:hypothetical protein
VDAENRSSQQHPHEPSGAVHCAEISQHNGGDEVVSDEEKKAIEAALLKTIYDGLAKSGLDVADYMGIIRLIQVILKR